MERDVRELEEEIRILKKKVSLLEAKDNRRQAFKYLRIIIKLALVALLVFGIWKGYDYIVNGLPKMVDEKIKDINPFKKG